MSERTAEILDAWLTRARPDGRCRRCLKPLPDDRRYLHVDCERQMRAAEEADELRRGAEARQQAVSVDRGLLDEVTDDGLVVRRVALDDPNFPAPDRWSAEAFAKLSRWMPDAPGVWLSGSVGGGKTTLLVGLALKLRSEGVSCCVTGYQYLLDGLRHVQHDDPRRYRELLDALSAVPVLLLDDAFIRTPTPWEVQVLYQLLNGRCDRGLPLVVATNCAPTFALEAFVALQLQDHGTELGRRIASRLRVAAPEALRVVYPGDRRTGEFSEELARQLERGLGARR